MSSKRLAELASHLTISRLPKVVVTRNLGPVMPLLDTRKDIEVCMSPYTIQMSLDPIPSFHLACCMAGGSRR